MLGIVQNQERRPVETDRDQLQRVAALRPDAESAENRRRNRLDLAQCDERTPGDVCEVGIEVEGQLLREPGLAHAADPGQSDEPCAVSESSSERIPLTLPSDEGTKGVGDGGGDALGAADRRAPAMRLGALSCIGAEPGERLAGVLSLFLMPELMQEQRVLGQVGKQLGFVEARDFLPAPPRLFRVCRYVPGFTAGGAQSFDIGMERVGAKPYRFLAFVEQVGAENSAQVGEGAAEVLARGGGGVCAPEPLRKPGAVVTLRLQREQGEERRRLARDELRHDALALTRLQPSEQLQLPHLFRRIAQSHEFLTLRRKPRCRFSHASRGKLLA